MENIPAWAPYSKDLTLENHISRDYNKEKESFDYYCGNDELKTFDILIYFGSRLLVFSPHEFSKTFYFIFDEKEIEGQSLALKRQTGFYN